MSFAIIPKCTTIIFDIGDVLFTWCPSTPTSIPSRTLRDIVTSPIWGQYECDKLSQRDCYNAIADEYAFSAEEVSHAIEYAQNSLTPSTQLLAFIQGLKSRMKDRLRIFAMSNISRPDYDKLRKLPVEWSVFDRIFTSFEAGMRKPCLSFYEYVLRETGADPSSTVFVDDKAENVLSARSLGMHGIVFDSVEKVCSALLCLVEDPIQRGYKFLENYAGRLDSVTDTGLVIGDNFAQLLILELMSKRSVICWFYKVAALKIFQLESS
jgi:FMN phosphatase YigB (HAD superfamily)